MKTETKTVYIADDGTEFATAEDCAKHELKRDLRTLRRDVEYRVLTTTDLDDVVDNAAAVLDVLMKHLHPDIHAVGLDRLQGRLCADELAAFAHIDASSNLELRRQRVATVLASRLMCSCPRSLHIPGTFRDEGTGCEHCLCCGGIVKDHTAQVLEATDYDAAQDVATGGGKADLATTRAEGMKPKSDV